MTRTVTVVLALICGAALSAAVYFSVTAPEPAETARPLPPEQKVARAQPVSEPPRKLPTAEEEIEVARQALREGSLTAALSAARRSVVIQPSFREGWDLLAGGFDAVNDATNAREAYEKRAALPAPPAVEEAPLWPAPKKGARVYVDASAVRVFKAASKKSKVLQSVRLNQKLVVLSVKDELAEVEWTPDGDPVWVVDLGKPAEAKRIDSQKKIKGWVIASYLAPSEVTAEGLAARVKDAEAKHDALAKVRALERQAVLTGYAPDALRALMSAAVDARQYALAAVQAVRLGKHTDNPSPKRSEPLELWFGCHAAPPIAETECTDEVASEVTCSETCQWKAPPEVPRGAMTHPPAEDDEFNERKLPRQSEVRAQFPSGPWFHEVVLGDDALLANGMRPFAFAVPLEPKFTCGVNMSAMKYDEAKVWAPPGSWPPKGRRVEIWLTGGGYESVSFGVLPAKSEVDAREQMKTLVTATPFGSLVETVSGVVPPCDCCPEGEFGTEIGE
jgi:hypothetical protein